MDIERGTLRPPSEARSLMLRVVRNCPWNRCRFCPAYKGEDFSLRSVEEVVSDISRIADDPDSRKADTLFLQDADALAMPTRGLSAILEEISRRLPWIARVTAYARVNTLAARPLADLRLLSSLGLSRVHVGFESGSNEVLSSMDKGTDADREVRAGRKAKEAGFELACYFMPGLGGKRLSDRHADESAEALRRIGPDHVRLRTCFVLEDTPLAQDYREGLFEPLSEAETVSEIRRFILALDGARIEIASDHRMNLLLELNGRLPEDREALIGTLDRYLALDERGRLRFEAGRRLDVLRTLDDLEDPARGPALDAAEKEYRPACPSPRSVLYPRRDAASARKARRDAEAS